MGLAKPSVIMDRLKQKVIKPIAETAQEVTESYQNKDLTTRFVDGVVKSSRVVGGSSLRGAGYLAKNVGANLVQGHWHDSGLSNIFGALPIGKHGRKLKRLKNRLRGQTQPTSGLGGNEANRIISAIRSSIGNLEKVVSGIDGSMAGLRNDVQVNTDVNRRGLLAILRALSSSAPNPFAGMAAARRPKPKPITVPPTGPKASALGGAGSLLSSLLGKGGLIGGALTGLLGTAKNLMTVVGALMGATGTLLKFASSLAGPLARGLAGLAAGTGMALGRGGRRAARALARSVQPRAGGRPVASKATVEASKPVVEAPKAPRINAGDTPDPKSTIDKNRPLSDSKQKPVGVDANGNPKSEWKPAYDPEKAKQSNQAKAEQVLGEAKTKLEGKPVEPVKEAPKPQSTPEAPKSTVETIKENASKGTATGTGEAAKQGVKQATKIGTGALSMTLARLVGPAALVAIEAWDGYNEWSEAYDKFKAGELSEEEYRKVQTTIVGKHTGAVAGALGGGLIGAGIGSVFGPIGAAVGGVVGGGFGAYYGSQAGESLSDTVLGQVIADGVAGRTKENSPDPKVKPLTRIVPDFSGITTRPRPNETETTLQSVPTFVRTENGVSASTQQMIAGSERIAAKQSNQAPIIVNAPQTTTNNNSSGGGASGGRHSPGSATPTFSGLEFNATGMGIPGLPGTTNY